jgi:hypothetical protein
MPDLNLGPTQHSSPLKSILIAIAILAAVAAAVFYFTPRRTAELSVPKVQIYAAHTTTAAQRGDFNVVGSLGENEDDLYVAVTLRVENKLRLPIFINSIDSTYTTPADTVLDTKALSLTDISRIEETFPALTPLMPNPLSFDPAIAPQSATEGTILLHFSGLTKQAWKARKSTTLTVNLAHQDPQTITIP